MAAENLPHGGIALDEAEQIVFLRSEHRRFFRAFVNLFYSTLKDGT